MSEKWQATFADVDGRVIMTGIYNDRGEPLVLHGGEKAADHIKKMTDELRTHDLALRIRYDADMRAIEMWQEAHPGNDLTWPGHTDLVVWLLEQLVELDHD